jgi:hypothetical protein
MKSLHTLLFVLVFGLNLPAQDAVKKIDPVVFFQQESPLNVTIHVDMKKMLRNKMKEGAMFPAVVTIQWPDSSQVSEPVKLETRGHYRKESCFIPPLKIHFKNAGAPTFSPLGALKLVNVCNIGNKSHHAYLLKEYLVYKLYNVITDKSYRVRLLHIQFADSSSMLKINSGYGFLMEDTKDLAERNDCVERKRNIEHTEATNRQQMTRVALFEYMIGNLDWSVPMRHNIKLIVSKSDTNNIPFAVPYDFDHSGLVHTDYALPPTNIGVSSVTERVYRGFERTMQELQLVADEFLGKKQEMLQLINGFDLLPVLHREEMVSFLNDFFKVLSKPGTIRTEFIENARNKH